MRRVRRDVDGLSGAHDRLFAAEGGFNLAFEEGEELLEIMPAGRRATAGRGVHVDQPVATVSIVAREQNKDGYRPLAEVNASLNFFNRLRIEIKGHFLGLPRPIWDRNLAKLKQSGGRRF